MTQFSQQLFPANDHMEHMSEGAPTDKCSSPLNDTSPHSPQPRHPSPPRVCPVVWHKSNGVGAVDRSTTSARRPLKTHISAYDTDDPPSPLVTPVPPPASAGSTHQCAPGATNTQSNGAAGPNQSRSLSYGKKCLRHDSGIGSKESASSPNSAHHASSSHNVSTATNHSYESHLNSVLCEVDYHPLDGATHREVAVDVPDTFVAQVKRAPRFPASAQTLPHSHASLATIPCSKATSSCRRVKCTDSGAAITVPSAEVDCAAGGPARDDRLRRTSSQGQRIRKIQEELRHEKDMKQRRNRENCLLRNSLRDSEKLRRLEKRRDHIGATSTNTDMGVDNTAYLTSEQDTDVLVSTHTGHQDAGEVATVFNGDCTRAAAVYARRQPNSSIVAPSGDLANAADITTIDIDDLTRRLKQCAILINQTSEHLHSDLDTVSSLLASTEFSGAVQVLNLLRAVRGGSVAAAISASHPDMLATINEISAHIRDQSQQTADMQSLDEMLTSPTIASLADVYDQLVCSNWPSGVQRSADRPPATSGDLPQNNGCDSLEYFAQRVNNYTDSRVCAISIDKTNDPLGATVKNENDSIIISRIVKGGSAERSGLLKTGDELLEVNGIELRGRSIDEVCDILANLHGNLVFIVLPGEPMPLNDQMHPSVIHVKAHFDYDPEDDIYVPCREIGLQFHKGEILHVTCQDDPDWWQAQRDGEEDITLSGLIPSMSFQAQRQADIMINDQRLMTGRGGGGGKGATRRSLGETTRRRLSAGASSLLFCRSADKRKRMRRHRSLTDSAYLHGGDWAELDDESILTYEQVGLYYPRADYKRPVVLIGPPNVGRQELRQRLMEDTERFSAAVPHTSRGPQQGEIDGRDYHFISRQCFEKDIVGRQFVEYGEYERAYYGTSIKSIRRVIAAGKICVLNLHPQSIRTLYRTDLKPFIVFVAPPSLEKLRALRHKTGQHARDDELKLIIEKSREIENTYGHYFDIVLINLDLDRTYHQLLQEINTLEREPQWVPISWL